MNPEKAVRPWKILNSQYIWQRPWFTLRVDRVQTGRGVVLEEYPVIESRDWACVVAVTKERQLVLVQQYRHGAGQLTLELPAGGVDDGENPEVAARRELREETGYAAERWEHLLSVSPETTRRPHRSHWYLALDAEQVGEPEPEPSEDLEVVLRPVLGARTLVTELSHGIHIAALLLALERYGDVLK